ncbi:MAG: carboxymuconolactone decarboxylase family protein [Pseudomonadota bacterium]
MAKAARVSPPDSSTGNLIRDSAMGLVAETIDHYVALTLAIWDKGPLGAADIELARLRSAHHVGCVVCKAVRYDVAVADGLDERQASRIGDDISAGDFSPRQQLILQFVDLYLHSPGLPEKSMQRALDAEFSSEEQAHLALALAYFNSSSRCAVALGGMPDSLPRFEMPVPR